MDEVDPGLRGSLAACSGCTVWLTLRGEAHFKALMPVGATVYGAEGSPVGLGVPAGGTESGSGFAGEGAGAGASVDRNSGLKSAAAGARASAGGGKSSSSSCSLLDPSSDQGAAGKGADEDEESPSKKPRFGGRRKKGDLVENGALHGDASTRNMNEAFR